MQINSVVNLPQQIGSQRLDRLQQDGQSRERPDDTLPPSDNVVEITPNENDLQRRIEASQQARETSLERQQEELTFNSQRALQTFQDNSPSIEQQLGVEIVGIDTFA